MMNGIYEAAEINNLGAHLLDHGHVSDAILAFQRSIEVVNICSSRLEARRMGVLASDFDDAPLVIAFYRHRRSRYDFSGIQNDAFYVYDRPLLLSVHREACTVAEYKAALSASSALLVFNLGLALHHMGKQSGKELHLKRATDLYEICVRILDGFAAKKCAANDMRTVLVCLALNNLAQILYDLCDYRQSRECMIRLDLQVMQLDLRVDSPVFDTEAREEILLNLVRQDPPFAAGAA